MNIYTIGHKSPDLDTIAAAVAYAEFIKKSKRYEGAKVIPLRPDEPNKETQFVFEKLGVEMPQHIDDVEIDTTDAFVLCDHNEESQRHEKVPAEQVVEIIDHHKINISFTSPVRIDVKPFGATCSLVYELFDMYGLKPSKETKGLMLAAVLSDTQGLKSKLTTGYDSDIAHKMAEDLDMDLEKFTFELFKAKSDITGMSAMEITKKDYKVFDFGGNKVFINQLETVEPEKALEQKEGILAAMEEVKSEEGAGQSYVVVTDVIKLNSKILYNTEEEKRIVEKAFVTEGHDNLADIGPRTSRKKDIAPEIEKVVMEG